MDTRPDLGDAAIGLASVAIDIARIPLTHRAAAPRDAPPRARRRDGADAHPLAPGRAARRRSAGAELERAVDRVIAGPLPDAVVRSLLEHQVVERLAVELAAEVDVDLAVSAALEHETTQRLVAAIVASPGLDQLLVQATDRVLRGPELQRVVEHVASSPEVRDALTQQSTTLATELADGPAHAGRDARRRRRTHGARMVATAVPRLSAPYAGIATRGIALAARRCAREPDRAAHRRAGERSWATLVGDAAAGVARRPAGRRRLAARVTFYFALFWSTTGQTPGMRLMRLQVIDRCGGEPPHLLRALRARGRPRAGDHPAVRGLPTGALRCAPPRGSTICSRAPPLSMCRHG